MSAEGSTLSDQHSIRAIALRIAVSSVTPTPSAGFEAETRNRAIEERARSYANYLMTGEF